MMLNFGRYLNLYWDIHQWNTNNAVTYKFHTFYRKLNFNTVTSRFVLCQLPYYDVFTQSSVTSGKTGFTKSVIVCKEYNKFININSGKNQLQIPKFNIIKFYIYKPVSNDIWLKPIQKRNTTKLNVIAKEINFFSKAWVVGYKKLSFYVKKTIVYEKNRKVRKAKLFLQFSKLYNFFKNIINVFISTSSLPKKYIYIYFLKKQFKLSVNYIFKCLAQRLVTQKKKPLILNVPYRK